MTLCSYASHIALHPGHPCVRPCASKSNCFRYTLFDGPASAGGLAKEVLRPGSVVAITPLSHGPNCRCLPVSRSVPWPDRYVDRSPQGWPTFLTPVSFGLSEQLSLRHSQSRCTHLNFIRKPTNIPGSILSSAFVRSVNGPTRYHTLSPNTHLPMWCPRPRHRSNGTFPSTQLCPGSARWWRAQSSKQWSSISVVSASGN